MQEKVKAKFFTIKLSVFINLQYRTKTVHIFDITIETKYLLKITKRYTKY